MTGFRVGDWVCANPSCAYHNFARNTWCRKCNTRKTQLSPDSSATTSNSAIPSQSNSLNSSLASSTNNWVPAREPIVGSIAKVSADTLTLVQQDEQGEWQDWDYKPDSARDKNQGTVWKVERGQISEPGTSRSLRALSHYTKLTRFSCATSSSSSRRLAKSPIRFHGQVLPSA
jgi:hypothetical protein